VGIRKGVLGRAVALIGAVAATTGIVGLPAGAAPNATTLYHQAMATTRSWSVHYASDGTISDVPILESGDAGPVSGTQVVLVGKGTATDNASLVVIGDITYLKGNVGALEDLASLSSAEATSDQGKWVLFSTTNPAFAQVVAGVRSSDVAEEIALKGPYTLGPSRTLDGYKVDAIFGTQELQGSKKTKVVMYVQATGRHLVVEEDSVGTKGKPNGADRFVFSKWGEKVQPSAPDATITLGAVNAT
jgi:hypothetical protein